jgi:hypothetical protein
VALDLPTVLLRKQDVTTSLASGGPTPLARRPMRTRDQVLPCLIRLHRCRCRCPSRSRSRSPNQACRPNRSRPYPVRVRRCLRRLRGWSLPGMIWVRHPVSRPRGLRVCRPSTPDPADPTKMCRRGRASQSRNPWRLSPLLPPRPLRRSSRRFGIWKRRRFVLPGAEDRSYSRKLHARQGPCCPSSLGSGASRGPPEEQPAALLPIFLEGSEPCPLESSLEG